jgi:hypothetical protein
MPIYRLIGSSLADRRATVRTVIVEGPGFTPRELAAGEAISHRTVPGIFGVAP